MTTNPTPDRPVNDMRELYAVQHAIADAGGTLAPEVHKAIDGLREVWDRELRRAQAEVHQYRTALQGAARNPASAVVAVAAPPTGQTALRDRIAEALAQKFTAPGFGNTLTIKGRVDRPLIRWTDGQPPQWGLTTPNAVADAVMAVLPPPAARADEAEATLERIQGVVRRLANHAVGFQDVLDDSDRDPWGRLVGADIAELRRMADEAQQQPETQARPAAHEWFVETRMLDGHWRKYGASRDTAADGHELFERDTTASGKAHAFRLIHATTTYAVEAEHQPAVVSAVPPQPEEKRRG